MDTNSYDNAFPLQFAVFKIENDSNTQVRDSQIIQHQAPLVISNPINYLCVHNDRIEGDEVRDKEANFLALVKNIERRLLPKRNFPQSEFNDQRIFVWLLNDSVLEGVQNLDSPANNLEHFVADSSFSLLVSIRVYSWLLCPFLSRHPNHQPQIEEQKRRGKQQTIQKIECPADSRQQIPGVLYICAALDD